jgi:Cyclic nucleotide-binding domain
VREGELRGAGELVSGEPVQLDEIVAWTGLAGHACRPREAQDDATVVGLEPEAEKGRRFELERGLLVYLTPQRVERMLVLVEKAAREIPEARARIDPAPSQEHASLRVEADGLGGGNGVRVPDEPAARANDAVVGALDSLGTHGAEPPAVESAHAEDHMSPRAAGATQHELSRVGLLATLPGETLARLAQRMTREEIPAGAPVVNEGDRGDRFYVVLSGMLTVSQQTRGPQSVLRPGDYFGEVALAMDMPRTASVRALTPATLASCDRATFDEYVRPLFADDEGG